MQFILEESGLALDATKFSDGAVVPVPVCVCCGRSKEQVRLEGRVEADQGHYLCVLCAANGRKPSKGYVIPAVVLRPWDSPEHLAFRRERSAARSKRQAAKEAESEVKGGKARGTGFEAILQAKLSGISGLVEMDPQDEAEGIAEYVLVGWRGFSVRQGKKVVDLPYSREAAINYLVSPTAQDFRTFVVRESKKRGHFDALIAEADAKN
jgi:hypothetical protein